MLCDLVSKDIALKIIWEFVDPVPLECVRNNHSKMIHELRRYWVHVDIRKLLKNN